MITSIVHSLIIYYACFGTRYGVPGPTAARLVLLVRDVDCVAAEGHALGPHIQPDEDGQADDRGVLPLADPKRGVEVQVFGAAGDLVLSIEVEQHAVQAAAGVRRHAQAVEGDLDPSVLEARVRDHVAGVPDRYQSIARRGRRKVAERMSSVLPGLVLERPEPLAYTERDHTLCFLLRPRSPTRGPAVWVVADLA